MSRWNTLVKMYLDSATLQRFIAGCKQIYAGDCRNGASTSMVCRNIIADTRRKSQRWGNCILGVTFTATGTGPELTMFSRCTYNGYMSFLDAAIIHVLARSIGDAAKIKFRWHVGTLQISGLKTIPYLLKRPKLLAMVKESRRDSMPAAFLLRTWIDRIERDYARLGVKMIYRDATTNNERYGQLRRMKRRWLEIHGDLKENRRKSLHVSTLTLDRAYVPEP